MATTHTEEAFEADLNADVRAAARSRVRPTQSYQDQERKKHTIGNVDGSVYEETPLLERESAGDGDSLSSTGSDKNPPEWSGARDFENRLWWRKPSVNRK